MGAGGAERPKDLPIKYHDVMIALSKAKAGLWLLLEAKDLGLDLGLTREHTKILGELEVDTHELRDWLDSIAADVIAESIRDAEAGFLKVASQHPLEVV